ncbi:Lrp/AsnC family transcriptional regulator [bacterium]|nr:Lrp/AsnC family transcriptional regulator [bacterium]
MKDAVIDTLDKQLIKLLSLDGRKPAKELAQQLNVSAPTVQSRLKELVKRGVLKVVGLVDPFKVKNVLVAIIAIRVDDVIKMPKIIDQLMEFKQVSWAIAVTGRYDIFAEVIVTEGIEWMFKFYADEMSKLDGVSHSESFMVTQTRRKWTLLPPNIEGWIDP